VYCVELCTCLQSRLPLKWGNGFVVGVVALDRFSDSSGCCVLELVNVICCLGFAYHCCTLAAFVLAILSVGISGGEAGSPVRSFGGIFC